jgi:hypothetical protein
LHFIGQIKKRKQRQKCDQDEKHRLQNFRGKVSLQNLHIDANRRKR